MAERLEGAAQRVVDRAAVTADDQVLDVACGTGNAATDGRTTVILRLRPRAP